MVAAANLTFALLALLCLATAVALVGVALLRGRGAAARALDGRGLHLAAAVAATATAGSLFYSEVAGFTPCRLCWVQRGLMYPLAAVCGALLVAYRRAVHAVAFAGAVAGVAVAVWHYLNQHIDALAGASSCSVVAPCAVAWVRTFGFVTIPFMAACGFLLVATVLAVTWPAAPSRDTDKDL